MTRNSILVVLGVLLLVAVGAFSFLVLGGGDDDGDGAPADADPTSTLDAGEFGPAPRLGDWVLEIFPVHASVIPQSQTRTTNPNDPSGVCFEASFHDLPQNALWFRMAVDGEEVTDKGIWIVESREDPEGGKFCYDPEDGLEVGIHDAAVSVQDPNNPNQPTRQLVAWKFEVVAD